MSKSPHVHDSLLSPLGLSPLSRSVSPVPWLDCGTELEGPPIGAALTTGGDTALLL